MNPVFKQFVAGGVLSVEERKQLDSIQFLSTYNFATGPHSFSDNAHQVCLGAKRVIAGVFLLLFAGLLKANNDKTRKIKVFVNY
jgi:hypothetical protein